MICLLTLKTAFHPPILADILVDSCGTAVCVTLDLNRPLSLPLSLPLKQQLAVLPRDQKV